MGYIQSFASRPTDVISLQSSPADGSRPLQSLFTTSYEAHLAWFETNVYPQEDIIERVDGYV